MSYNYALLTFWSPLKLVAEKLSPLKFGYYNFSQKFD